MMIILIIIIPKPVIGMRPDAQARRLYRTTLRTGRVAIRPSVVHCSVLIV